MASHRLDPYEALNLRSVCSRQLHGNLGPCKLHVLVYFEFTLNSNENLAKEYFDLTMPDLYHYMSPNNLYFAQHVQHTYLLLSSLSKSMTKDEYLLLLFHVEQVKQIHGNNSIINAK